jgi:YesN/AraC family two-component response regulator
MNILIADDSNTIRGMLVRLIKQSFKEINCIEAKDGKEAFHELTKNKFDLIITDIDMGEHDGDAFIYKILGNKLLKNKNIIVYSSKDKNDMGAMPSNVHFITKMSGQDKLINKIKQLLPES